MAEASSKRALQVLADRFDRGTELLADNLLHPHRLKASFNAVSSARV